MRSLLLVCVALATVAALIDGDRDGVPDDADACPQTKRASREHVDANGCAWEQVDVDRDGWCDPDRPKDKYGRWLRTRDDWCMGVDNCKWVYNPDQTVTVPGAVIGDTCNTGASVTRSRACDCVRSVCVCVCVWPWRPFRLTCRRGLPSIVRNRVRPHQRRC
jgi:hypothetical protein